ncbi:MAG: hypothetical protein RR290_02795 [Clostridia bacterium]
MLKLNIYDFKNIINPAGYIGGEYNQVIKEKSNIKVRYAMCFPDIYEKSVNNINLKTMYSMLNNRIDTWCERVYAPCKDFENLMRKKKIKMYGLESKDYLDSFDIINFNLDDEMQYTNVLNIIDLCNIPLYAKDRQIRFPFVMATGKCTDNPYPLSPFIDIYIIGEFEEVISLIIDKYMEWKNEIGSKIKFLNSIKDIDGVYIPLLHTNKNNINRVIIKNLNSVEYAKTPIVSNIKNNNDKIYIEVERVNSIKNRLNFENDNIRENTVQKIVSLAKTNYIYTGINEICLDFNYLEKYYNMVELIEEMLKFTNENKIKLSFRNLKLNADNILLLKKINYDTKQCITLDIGASSQRLRDIICSNITEKNILDFAKVAFENNFNNINLKFKIGLPSEDYLDLNDILDICNKIFNEYYKIPKKQRKRKCSISITTEIFIPKPHTFFECFEQASQNKLEMKQQFLNDKLTKKNIRYIYDDIFQKNILGYIQKGDVTTGKVIYNAWRFGSRFDNNKNYFDYNIWMKALEKENIKIEDYINKRYDINYEFCFDNIYTGINKEDIKQEYSKILKLLEHNISK